MSIMNLLFSTEGRINRKKWWLGQLIAFVFVVVISTIFHFSIPVDLSFMVFSVHNFVIGMIAGIFYFWIHISLNVKRFHDINKHGSWTILCYTPIIGFLITIIVCGCISGDKDSNKYG